MDMPQRLEDVYKKTHRNLVAMGNSVGLTLHTDERENIGGLEAGDPVEVIVTDNAIIIKPGDDQ